jgi:class 3 adenylate cyclase/tetratricopeptide (TPR) repeat protein
MSSTLDEQIIKLKQAIAEMEAQRSVLGDTAVDASLVPFHEKLAELEALAEPPKEAPSEVPVRHRKLVTLLYMDVVGSTAMTQHLDPEDTLEIMDNALPRLAEPIEKHGGHVTRYTGDGFKAVFGDPIAREDDPEQAIRAGLEILDISKTLSQELETEREIENFQVRIGIDTGLAALGGQTEAEDTVMGRVVNMAARIESAAPPGALLISHNTYRHVRGVFNVEPQKPITAKGFPEAVPVYQVLDIKPRAFRVQTRGVEGVETRMVGRQAELIFLQDALLTAIEEGEGQAITIAGEAGVGKSRLLYEFDNWIELLPPPPVLFFQGQGRQESRGLPYSLLRDVFAFRFQILDDDTGEQARCKLEAGFGKVFSLDEDGMMRTHILGQLLGFDFSASPHLKGVLNDAEQLRNRGLMYLKEYFQKLSQENPIVILMEDIHWGDESSLDVVNQLGESASHMPFVIACAARPTLFERRPYWGEGQAYHTLLELRPLSKRESRQLVAEILKLAEDIPSELRELVIIGAEGNPFYMEELIKMLIENGVVIPGEETWQIEANRLEQVAVPSTLAGVLQARLDSLPIHERTVLQQASVVGRLFWDRIVTYIQAEGGDGDDPQLIPLALASLRDRELVYRHEESAFVGTVEYIFKHDVLREVTYESVLKRLRRIYHGLVADWLIANSSDRVEEHSGLIAEHLLLSGRIEQACEYFNQAGDIALASYANHEAESYYRQALKLSTPDPLRAELLVGVGEALYRQGLSEKAGIIWQQAIDLYRCLGDNDRLADVYTRLSRLLWYINYFDAWNICKEGLDQLDGASDSHGYARLLAEAGRTALFINLTDQVIPLCLRAVEMSQRLGYLEVQADASVTLALRKEDKNAGIAMLEEVVELTEAEGLLSSSIRANINLGYCLEMFLVDMKSALQHELRAAEIARQIGDIEGMMLALGNAYEYYIHLGEYKTVEDEVNEFFQGFPIPKSRIKKFFNENRHHLLRFRGEWIPALEAKRARLEELRQGEKILLIEETNFGLVDLIMELNCFGYLDDLSEAEAALEENIETHWYTKRLHLLLALVSAMKKRFPEARDYIVRAENNLSGFENNLDRELSSRVEFELACSKGCWEEAVAACEASIEIYRSCSHRWGWARRLIDLGDAFVGRNESDDLERARQTYQQSLDMFTDMGAQGYVKVLEERLGDL